MKSMRLRAVLTGVASIMVLTTFAINHATAEAPPPGSAADKERPAATIEVIVTNVRNSKGVVRAALCLPHEFLSERCAIEAIGPAHQGTVRLTLNGIPPGRYAIQAWHDEKSKGQIERDWLGIPYQGVGFSNDPILVFGPPTFDKSAVSLTSGGNTTTLRLRYFK